MLARRSVPYRAVHRHVAQKQVFSLQETLGICCKCVSTLVVPSFDRQTPQEPARTKHKQHYYIDMDQQCYADLSTRHMDG